jgi:hypothetical protein
MSAEPAIPKFFRKRGVTPTIVSEYAQSLYEVLRIDEKNNKQDPTFRVNNRDIIIATPHYFKAYVCIYNFRGYLDEIAWRAVSNRSTHASVEYPNFFDFHRDTHERSSDLHLLAPHLSCIAYIKPMLTASKAIGEDVFVELTYASRRELPDNFPEISDSAYVQGIRANNSYASLSAPRNEKLLIYGLRNFQEKT